MNYGDGTGNSPLILRTDGALTLSHTYQASGEYPVTVSVSDDDSGAGVASRTAVVEKLNASLSAAAAQATYGGTTTLSATLAVGDVPLAGKTVTFTLRGAAVGSAVTGSTGEVVLAGVSLVGLDAGVAPLTTSFVGDERHAAATGNATVQIAKAHLVVVVDDNSRVYGHDNPVLTGSVFGQRTATCSR